MNLTHNLEQFTNELTDIFNRLGLLKHHYPTLFKEVLPDGEELRLEDALTALQNAEAVGTFSDQMDQNGLPLPAYFGHAKGDGAIGVLDFFGHEVRFLACWAIGLFLRTTVFCQTKVEKQSEKETGKAARVRSVRDEEIQRECGE